MSLVVLGFLQKRFYHFSRVMIAANFDERLLTLDIRLQKKLRTDI